MLRKVLLAGATGGVGKALLQTLLEKGYAVRVLVREKAEFPDGVELHVGDVQFPETLSGCCNGCEIVISAVGASVSPSSPQAPDYHNVDFQGNLYLLTEAKRAHVKKFAYISVYGAETWRSLTYFGAHADFSAKLRSSGLNYTILKPVGIFCAYQEVFEMAKKGRAMLIGNGEAKTNPIHELDVAEVCVAHLDQKNTELEMGGSEIFTRYELTSLILEKANYFSGKNAKIRRIPLGLTQMMLNLMKFFAKKRYDNAVFLKTVSTHESLAPAIGTRTLDDYLDGL